VHYHTPINENDTKLFILVVGAGWLRNKNSGIIFTKISPLLVLVQSSEHYAAEST
jgi:hypothetical protein